MKTHTLPLVQAGHEQEHRIDLRSDTVTKPTPAMLSAMVSAPVGDDVYGEDPTINALERYMADITGKEAALFVPSGTMSNQLAIKVHCRPGDEVIVESESHIFQYETAGPSVLSGVQLHCLASESGLPEAEAIADAIRPREYYYPPSRLFCLENTHNRHGGTVAPANEVAALSEKARSYGLKTHLDGARLWNAAIALKLDVKTLCSPFDSVSLCLSKGLGAPVGSVLVGSRTFIKEAHRWRKIWGGGMRQAGILAAAGLFVLQHHLEGLAKDHNHAYLFARLLAQSPHIELPKGMPQSNIVIFSVEGGEAGKKKLIELAASKDILLSSGKGNWIRAVFHHQINAEEASLAADTITELLKGNR